MEKYPNLNKGVDSSICGCERVSLLDKKTKSPPTTRQAFTPLHTKRILEHNRTNWLKFTSDFLTSYSIIIIIIMWKFIHAYPTNVVQNVTQVTTNNWFTCCPMDEVFFWNLLNTYNCQDFVSFLIMTIGMAFGHCNRVFDRAQHGLGVFIHTHLYVVCTYSSGDGCTKEFLLYFKTNRHPDIL